MVAPIRFAVRCCSSGWTVTAEIGTETRHFRARTATGDEREAIWSRQKREYPGFPAMKPVPDGIPVVVLNPIQTKESPRRSPTS